MKLNPTWVRKAEPTDAADFVEWSLSTANNSFDPAAAAYPSSVTLCAGDETGPLVFLPLQAPILLESLAVRPGASRRQVVLALQQLIAVVANTAEARGTGEIYFLGTEDGTNSLAESSEYFERLPWPVYRMRVKDLKPGIPDNDTAHE
jgi:hypothetical protein